MKKPMFVLLSLIVTFQAIASSEASEEECLAGEYHSVTMDETSEAVFEEGREVLWKKQVYDKGRGSKYNKPPIRALATKRLQKQIDALTIKCGEEKGVLTSDENYIKWGCCTLNSSRPCLYPGYPYPKDPGGCVATVGAKVICEIP